jgi:hypothetical protein
MVNFCNFEGQIDEALAHKYGVNEKTFVVIKEFSHNPMLSRKLGVLAEKFRALRMGLK